MTFVSNPYPTPIKLTVDELRALYDYLYQCETKGFHGINDYARINKDREYMYRWHLREFTGKVIAIGYKILINSHRKHITVKVTEIEQRTLSMMFKRVECDPFMLIVQQKLLNNLLRL